MVVGIKRSIGALAIGISALAFTGAIAVAQEATSDDEVITIPEAFDQAFFNRSGTAFEADRFPRSLTWFIGPNYPENAITSDAENVHELYTELIQQQVSNSPPVRTQDLTNPFSTSLRLTPDLGVQSNPIPPAEPLPVYPPIQYAPPPPVRPVPALW